MPDEWPATHVGVRIGDFDHGRADAVDDRDARPGRRVVGRSTERELEQELLRRSGELVERSLELRARVAQAETTIGAVVGVRDRPQQLLRRRRSLREEAGGGAQVALRIEGSDQLLPTVAWSLVTVRHAADSIGADSAGSEVTISGFGRSAPPLTSGVQGVERGS